VNSGRATLRRYLLIESPGWVLAGFVAAMAHRWLGLPAGLAGLAVALWIVKDLVLYPWLRAAFEDSPPSELQKLVGSSGVVQIPLDPVGVVRLGHELWRAEADRAIPTGRSVRVRAVRGLTLQVVENPPDPGR
jgi:membrane protein implicated in regulation of membrane protease activity